MTFRASLRFVPFLSILACSNSDDAPVVDVSGQSPVGKTASAEEPLAVALTASGAPLVLHGNFSRLQGEGIGARAFAPALERVAMAHGVAVKDLVFVSSERDELGMAHARYRQELGGIPVIGSSIRVHADVRGNVFATTGSAVRAQNVEKTPALDEAAAESIAARTERSDLRIGGAASPRLVYVVTPDHKGAHLAFQVTVRGEDARGPVVDDVFVDAVSGIEVARHPRIHYARDRKTYSANNTSSLPGTLGRSENEGAVANIDVNAAYDNAGYVYDYYFATFGRDSFDNQGATLISTVNYGSRYNNAFWNGEQMVYGDGDGQVLSPLGRSLDVTGHEITHAVTERTAGLIYSGESGGLNESMSDIFGSAIEAARNGVIDERTWLLGEDVWTPNTPGDALRYLDDPAKDGESLDDYNSMNSWIDVHYSSGISNLAFKLLVTGGKHPRGKSTAEVPALGMEQASAIFFRALTVYMTEDSNFEAARVATAQAAKDLYGESAAAAVHKTWDALNVPNGAVPVEAEAIENNAPKTNISGNKGTRVFYKITIPEGTTTPLRVKTAGTVGDADLFVRYDRPPTSGSYDASSESSSSNESITINTPKAGTYYIMVRAYSTFSGLTLTASY
jgi:vibriolysin